MNEATKLILGSLIRAIFQIVAGALVAYGITEVQQKSFIEAGVPIVTALILALVGVGWSVLQKRWTQTFVEKSHLAPPSTPLSEVKDEASKDVLRVAY